MATFSVLGDHPGPEGEGGMVKGPPTELKIYRGIWMPALAKEFLTGMDIHPMSDVETLRKDGVNIVQLAPEVVVKQDGSIDFEAFQSQAAAICQAMSYYHSAGFEVFLTLVVRYGSEGEPVPVPRSIVERPGFIQQYNSLVLEWAEVAQEYEVELFAPTLEPDYYLGGVEYAANWCQEILPLVRERYKGKLMVRLAFQDIALQHIDFNIQGYDVLGICIYPFDDTTLTVDREKVKFFIDEALKLASKYGVSAVVTESGVWGKALSASEEVKAEAYRVVLEEGEGKLDGFFLTEPPLSNYGSLKDSLAERVIREWYTERLLEPADLEVCSLTLTPSEVLAGEEVEVNIVVSNLGEKMGSKEITLKVDGEVRGVEELTLEGGGSAEIVFKLVEWEPGLHVVEVDGLNRSFKVNSAIPEAFECFSRSLKDGPLMEGEELKVTLYYSPLQLPDIEGYTVVAVEVYEVLPPGVEVVEVAGQAEAMKLSDALKEIPSEASSLLANYREGLSEGLVEIPGFPEAEKCLPEMDEEVVLLRLQVSQGGNLTYTVKVAEATTASLLFQGVSLIKVETPGGVYQVAGLIKGDQLAKCFKTADLTGDGRVNNDDLEALRTVYGLTRGVEGFQASADLNSDGSIDVVDLAILACRYQEGS